MGRSGHWPAHAALQSVLLSTRNREAGSPHPLPALCERTPQTAPIRCDSKTVEALDSLGDPIGPPHEAARADMISAPGAPFLLSVEVKADLGQLQRSGARFERGRYDARLRGQRRGPTHVFNLCW
jgi:hypothetical protein